MALVLKYWRKNLENDAVYREAKGGKRKMKVYISGAITGTNDFMERFKAAEDRLTDEGMSVINPARLNSCMPKDTTYEEYMEVALHLLDMCEAIYMLKGWGNSARIANIGMRLPRTKQFCPKSEKTARA